MPLGDKEESSLKGRGVYRRSMSLEPLQFLRGNMGASLGDCKEALRQAYDDEQESLKAL